MGHFLTNNRIENTILTNLFHNEDYTRKTLPFIKPYYFSQKDERELYVEVEKFVLKYKNLPTKEAILIELNNRKDLNEEEYKGIKDLVNTISYEETDLQWLLDTKEKKYPFDLSFFNRITKGGVPSKTLNIALAGTGVGKSLFMCHVASSFLTQGQNVLYITLEMAEERIAERIDANLFDVTIDDLHAMPKDLYDSKLSKLEGKTKGKLIIKEYPTASAHSGHFRSLLNELALKKSFKPQVIFIDYLNICASSRFKGGNISSYFYIKAIAEELRGLAVEFDVPIFSATQTTRTGYVSTDIGLEDTSESFGLPATADFMFALMSNEELESLGQMKVKQLKNRYNDPSINRSFIIGIDKSKMRLYDVENTAQNIVDSNQLKQDESYPTPEQAYDKFSDFKV